MPARPAEPPSSRNGLPVRASHPAPRREAARLEPEVTLDAPPTVDGPGTPEPTAPTLPKGLPKRPAKGAPVRGPATEPEMAALADAENEVTDPGVRGGADGAVEVRARVAPLPLRLISWLVDATALGLVLWVYFFIASLFISPSKAPTQLSGLDEVVGRAASMEGVLVPGIVLGFVLAVAYSAVAAVYWGGRTFGQRVTQLRLVDPSGLAPAPPRALLRAALSVLSFALFCGGFWMALFDRRGQTLHDKLTNTFVVAKA
jgi:uncharacterized RDD family membrane protein YckC